jgi:uncharacterized coiled-coil DUF342 family protein
MNETTLTQAQRKGLVEMLNQYGYGNNSIWTRAKTKYDDARDSLTRSFIADYAKNGKLTDLMREYRTIQEKLLTSGIILNEEDEFTYAATCAKSMTRRRIRSWAPKMRCLPCRLKWRVSDC